MKKITLIICLFLSFSGISQVTLEGFEGTAPNTNLFAGFTSATVVANPDAAVGSGNESANVLELVTSATGDAWQAAELVIQNNTIDMTTSDKTMTVDIYSVAAVDYLFKLVKPVIETDVPANWSKTSISHPGNGWATLTLDFNVGADTGQPGYNPPNDKFGGIEFYPLYIYPNEGWNPAALTTTYVDNIVALEGGVEASCSDGIQNQDETGVDCGGPNCSPCGVVAESLEDFESTAPNTNLLGGFTSATVVANPNAAVGSGNESANVLELVTSATGDAWQAAELVIQNNTIDMTTSDKTMTVDIYSVAAVDYLFKLVKPVIETDVPANWSKTSISHPGNGWATLTLDFNVGADTGQPGYNPPNDKFGGIEFYPLYIYPNEGWNPAALTTTYVDNIVAIPGGVVETCSDGIQNQDETGIDCGGSICGDCPAIPLIAAPEPPARAAANVLSIYGDAYGTAVGLGNVSWDNGPETSEVTIVGSEKALQLAMNFGGFVGTQLSTVVDATSMTHFHMDFFIGDAYVADQVFNVKFSNHTGGNGETNAGTYDTAMNVDGSQNQTWVSVDVELSSFSAGIDPREALTQFLITTADRIGIAYVDNVYFHNNDTSLGTTDLEVSKFSAYPNPTNDKWTISSTSEISNISLFDILGKQVQSLSPNNNEASIDASSLGTGIYFAKIQGVNGSKTLKLIKQ